MSLPIIVHFQVAAEGMQNKRRGSLTLEQSLAMEQTTLMQSSVAMRMQSGNRIGFGMAGRYRGGIERAIYAERCVVPPPLSGRTR